MERPRTCLKVAPKLAHRSRVVVAMTRKKTAQAPSVLATMTVLSALIVNERFRLIAMVVGMRIVAHNGTELARWTSTSTQSQLFSLLVQSGADLHSCRSTVNSWSAESAPGLCDHRRSTSEERRTPSTCVSCRSTRTQLYRGSIFLRTELFLRLHKQQQQSVFPSGRSRNQRCCRCRCVVCRRRRAWRPPRKSCTTVYMDPTVLWEYFLCLDFFCTFTNNDNDLFSFSSLSPSLATSCSIL